MKKREPLNNSQNEAIYESSEQKIAKFKHLPASKVFDLKVVPSERANEPQGSHSFCATCSAPS